MSDSNGIVLWRGKSRLDGQPVVCIATGLVRDSVNPKTGPMVQVWILREDVHPSTALGSGADISVCGNCPLRPTKLPDDPRENRGCYAQMNGPNSVWTTYKAGGYPVWTKEHNALLRRAIRFGAYGDPAAVPYGVWKRLAALSTHHTGYTHQWRTCDQRLRALVMASADQHGDVDAANALGWRSFRVKTAQEPVRGDEIVCPAADEWKGRKLQCIDCGACHGCGNGKARNVVIDVHGTKAKLAAYSRSRISLL